MVNGERTKGTWLSLTVRPHYTRDGCCVGCMADVSAFARGRASEPCCCWLAFRLARPISLPPSVLSSLSRPSAPLDKLVFWNDRRLFWAWQTMRKERRNGGDAAAAAIALLTRGYLWIPSSLPMTTFLLESCRRAR